MLPCISRSLKSGRGAVPFLYNSFASSRALCESSTDCFTALSACLCKSMVLLSFFNSSSIPSLVFFCARTASPVAPKACLDLFSVWLAFSVIFSASLSCRSARTVVYKSKYSLEIDKKQTNRQQKKVKRMYAFRPRESEIRKHSSLTLLSDCHAEFAPTKNLHSKRQLSSSQFIKTKFIF